MVPYVETVIGRDGAHAGITTPDEYLAAHRRFIGRKVSAGLRVRVHESLVLRQARVHVNQWIIDCECGAGNAVDPRWGGIACCFGCGAIHRNILFPQAWKAIERELVARTEVSVRHWVPGESVEQLAAETAMLAEAEQRKGRR